MGSKTTNFIGTVLVIIFSALLLSGLIKTMRAEESGLERKLALTISIPVPEKPRFSRVAALPSDHPLNQLLESIFRPTERVPAEFDHVLHMEDIGEKGCLTSGCHTISEDGYLNLKVYEPGENDTLESITEEYHDNCIGCHIERDAGPKKECGKCHIVNKNYINLPFHPKELDLKQHNLHVVAFAQDEDCGACHHKYDEATEKLVSVKAEEAASCRDCHRKEDVDKVPSLRTAAHMKCVSCHMSRSGDGKKAGPVKCAGCHAELDTRPLLMDMSDVPRLKTKQKDMPFILVEDNRYEGVPFNHIDHEKIAKNCRTCHHESLKACKDCHTLKGDPEAGNITLANAYHDADSSHSCVGCHEVSKKKAQCAACHAAMAQGPTDASCATCHTGPADPNLPVRPSFDPVALLPKDLPETLTIDILQKTLKPVKFPHQAIILKLSKTIGDDKLANTFHGGRLVVCAGCHHNSPITGKKNIPRCSSCHNNTGIRSDINKPTLFGTYHRSCLECHKKMEVNKYILCNSCHDDMAAVTGNEDGVESSDEIEDN